MQRNYLLFLLMIALFAGCGQSKTYFEKEVEFPSKISDEEKIRLAAYVTPTPQQLEWQELELTAFIHFGVNTFTNKEWGNGDEDPAIFNPEDLDTEQWVKVLKDAGFKMVILTAKHHDGFCLWPTKTTAHSVASSPWRDGNGDVVRELRDACDKYDMKFGVYLSPWDRNAESYGDSERYNKFFVEQLKELLTNYGEIHEVWFDGANGEGPNGKKQIYDWPTFYHVIDSLQPKAVKAIMGNDVRWVGNEKGLGRATEWSVTPIQPWIDETKTDQNKELGISSKSEDLGSRKLIVKAKKLYWYPSEVDVSIRPGWFYHPEQDNRVKSLQELVDIYFQSVGMNSVLLLNIPPDTRGRIHENDALALANFGKYIQETFKDNKLSSDVGIWQAASGDSKEFNIKLSEKINTVMLQEEIKKGQRVEAFKVEALINGEWQKITEGTTIGHKRLLRFDDIETEKIRVTIQQTREKANIKTIGAFYAPHIEGNSSEMALNDVDKSNWNVVSDAPLTIDLGKSYNIKGVTYNPPKDSEAIFEYNLSVSENGNKWKSIKEKAEFSNIKNNPIAQIIQFSSPIKARFVKIETIRGADGGKPEAHTEQIGIMLHEK